MFTGLVEGTGRVVALESRGEITTLSLDAGAVAGDARPGDSIAINGCCLTVVAKEGERLSFELLQETLARTNLRHTAAGSRVNLERAMPAHGRYGGHFVTGHIDAVGRVRSWTRRGHDDELRIEIDPAHGIYVVPKGCIAIDGISLTVGEVGRDEFSVWIIPHTRKITALGDRAAGDAVNLEFDLLAKYAEKILAARGTTPAG